MAGHIIHITSLVVGAIVALVSLARLCERPWLWLVICHRLRVKRRLDMLPWECKRGHRSALSGTCHRKIRVMGAHGESYTVPCLQVFHLRPDAVLDEVSWVET